MPQLSQAEAEYFKSGGTVVAENLTKDLPAGPSVPTKGHNEAPDDKGSTPGEATPAAEPTAKPAEQAVTEPAKTPEEIAKANADATKARQKLLADLGAVPLEALQEARFEAKTLKQQQAELAAWKAQVEPLISQLKPQQQGNPYDPNQNPVEYSNYEWTALQNQVKTLTETQKQAEQTRLANENTQRVMNWGQAQERAFVEKQPDYAEAAKFAREARTKQLAVFNPDPAWIDATINNEIAGIIASAAQATMQGNYTNPAEQAYKYALANGYTPKAAGGKDKALEAMTKIAAGQAASGGLNGGSAPKGEMTMEDLARMPTRTPEQRQAYDAAWKKVMQG
jgi:hypothetical protein